MFHLYCTFSDSYFVPFLLGFIFASPNFKPFRLGTDIFSLEHPCDASAQANFTSQQATVKLKHFANASKVELLKEC